GHEPALLRLETAHEGKLRTFETGIIDDAFSFRPLKGKKYPVKRIDGYIFAVCRFVQMLDIGIGITSIGDDHETVFTKARDDQVIQHAAIFVEEERIF